MDILKLTFDNSGFMIWIIANINFIQSHASMTTGDEATAGFDAFNQDMLRVQLPMAQHLQ